MVLSCVHDILWTIVIAATGECKIVLLKQENSEKQTSDSRGVFIGKFYGVKEIFSVYWARCIYPLPFIANIFCCKFRPLNVYKMANENSYVINSDLIYEAFSLSNSLPPELHIYDTIWLMYVSIHKY